MRCMRQPARVQSFLRAGSQAPKSLTRPHRQNAAPRALRGEHFRRFEEDLLKDPRAMKHADDDLDDKKVSAIRALGRAVLLAGLILADKTIMARPHYAGTRCVNAAVSGAHNPNDRVFSCRAN